MLRRTLLALALVLAAGGAMARPAPGDPAAFVAELYREPSPPTDEPLAEPEESEPAEDRIYAASLRALLEIDAQRDMNYLDFDWVWGGQDLPDAKDLKIVVVKRTAETAQVRVTFLNYRERRERVIDLVVEDGAWVIEDVFLKVPERAWLSRILTENRQD
jgi:hypothetical protein